MTHHTHSPEEQQSAIVYPQDFPIKVMGLHSAELVEAVRDIAARHDPGFRHETIELRESREGKYLSVTITIRATSRTQLDAIYRELTAHPLSKWVI
ncbi:hypothetical protein AAV94_07240 [Lampropedia cohaerens]|uniref:UPF0250 protein AAV94_07240 n=1 Tax=Lampropedia cohaerens TaxID=1610491 RepID=A0A0U1PZM5_9BURK|nr:DUF493 domain-containing protein [Lampropedia cohaerens]KKW67960.1 hypothetical protein AAV94_07240 [Lampropedia cohaerens]